MARYALERIQAPQAGAALRDALPKVSGTLEFLGYESERLLKTNAVTSNMINGRTR